MTKFMMMAMAAMMMAMSGNVKAAESATPAPETMEAKSMNETPAEAIRVMLHFNDDVTNRFDYTLDTHGQVTSKTMYRFDKSTYKWIPVMQYKAIYGSDTNTLVFAAYDKKSGTFTNHKVSTSYDKTTCPILIALPECINY